MNKTHYCPIRFLVLPPVLLVGCVFFATLDIIAGAQTSSQKSLPVPDAPAQPHRTRLILKDGSYQIVMSYRVLGDRVLYVSAERGGVQEEIPASLVDFEATKRWERQHAEQQANDAGQNDGAPAIDPELLKEEAERASYTPEVAKDLRLPEQDSVLGLDIFQGKPELVPMPQSDSELNRNTSHNVLKAAINPLSSSHQLVQLKGERAAVQFHVDTPALFLRIGSDEPPATGGAPLTVDTHGASSAIKDAPAGGSAGSRYVIVRADVRQGARIVASFKISMLGSVHQQEDVIETAREVLSGGHWMKLTPRQPLEFGEYALMEVISDREVNLGVWDFGVHPVSPENRDVILPQPKRPLSLDRRRPE
ncbi:hypothetical protein [Edaphobacter bradus]|uniref:hypothetical protein n=1 Tax=Edaphobacter bradus TaxID=2259016 RepID=UPI0021E0ED42|nr:hypothetical protein [Edaphobacter bradus]